MAEREAGEERTPVVRVWLLGPFGVELRQPDGSWQEVPGQQWRTYFYARPLLQRLLCAHGRRLDRQQLLADLWPREEPSEAMERYPVTAAGQVRKVLGRPSLVQTYGQSYQLAGQGQLWTDVDAALEALQGVGRWGEEGPEELSRLERAESYFRRGRLLEEQTGSWVVARREWLAGERLRTGVRLARLYERMGSVREAAQEYTLLYETHPLDERVLLELYGWWLRQGERERAERVLEAGRQRLEQEGLPFSEEACGLLERLREGEGDESSVGRRLLGVVYWEGSKRAEGKEGREERVRVVAPRSLRAPCEGGSCEVGVVVWPLIWGRGGRGSLQELEQLIHQELSMGERNERLGELVAGMGQRMPRRMALQVLAGLPQVVMGLELGQRGRGGWQEEQGMKEGRLREEVLPVCAGSITAC
ncbi:BTAD domain-containing putative transcriptional regulator, partial [Thermogemmatispora sp.]|uniref:AfsR/SARP family transcriptional regulator n=1 Tax=Thermogemmatispora sp. TaxID=1968838 RepID=UPI0035E45E51